MPFRSFLIIALAFFSIKNAKGYFPDTTIILKSGISEVKVVIKWPGTPSLRGSLVVLPGWKLPVDEWCSKTQLCKKALAEGYVLIMPEMNKSIYSSHLYPETRNDWRIYATRTWFIDTLIRHIQKQYKLLLPSHNNFILGLSTGARGAALLSLDCPEIFKKCAALSGDYDQTRMPNDALMIGFYGPLEKFKDRWCGKDNITFRYKEFKNPIYLAHGKNDKVVPCDQTQQLCDSLLKYKPDLIKCHMNDTAKHDYNFWNSEIENVLLFFRK